MLKIYNGPYAQVIGQKRNLWEVKPNKKLLILAVMKLNQHLNPTRTLLMMVYMAVKKI